MNLRRVLGCLWRSVLVSAFPGWVLAAPTVVLYGVVDTGLGYNHVSRDAVGDLPALSASQLAMNSGVQSGSRWGVRGTEDMGDGWGVSFVLESGIDSTDGELGQGGRAFGRQSTLGLTHNDFGELVVGRQTTITTNYFAAIDPLGESFGQANMGASFGTVNTVRYDNLLQYQTPSWHGLQAGVGYSFNTGTSGLYGYGAGAESVPMTSFFGTSANMRALTAAVRYTWGDFDAVGSFDRAFAAGMIPSANGSGSQRNPAGGTPTAWILGATYNFKVVEVAFAFGKTYDGAFSGNGPGSGWSGSGLTTFSGGAGVLFDAGYDSQATLLGLTVPMGGGEDELMLSWQTKQPKGRLASDSVFATQSIFGVAYTYGLSKHANLYFWASYGNNFQMIRTAKSSVIGAGMRYLF